MKTRRAPILLVPSTKRGKNRKVGFPSELAKQVSALIAQRQRQAKSNKKDDTPAE